MNFLILAEMLECQDAHQVMLRFIASDFQKFSSHPSWRSPLLHASTYRKLMSLVPSAQFDGAQAPAGGAAVVVVGEGLPTRAASIAAMAPPDVGHAITAYNTKSVADTLRERLPREENQGQGSSRLATTTTTSVRKPLRRSDVRLRERERALLYGGTPQLLPYKHTSNTRKSRPSSSTIPCPDR